MAGKGICKVDGCEKKVLGRGWCWKHYNAAKMRGEFTPNPTRSQAAQARGKKKSHHKKEAAVSTGESASANAAAGKKPVDPVDRSLSDELGELVRNVERLIERSRNAEEQLALAQKEIGRLNGLIESSP